MQRTIRPCFPNIGISEDNQKTIVPYERNGEDAEGVVEVVIETPQGYRADLNHVSYMEHCVIHLQFLCSHLQYTYLL